MLLQNSITKRFIVSSTLYCTLVAYSIHCMVRFYPGFQSVATLTSEHIGRDEPLVDFDRVFVGILWRFIGRENVGHAKGGGDEHSECERLHGDSNITLQNHNNHNDTKSALNWYAIF